MSSRVCDFLVIGGGLGGLVAAAEARHRGLDVIVLEKTEYVGGVAAYSGGIVWVGNNHLGAAAGYADNLQDAGEYLAYISGTNDPNYDQNLRRVLVEESPRIIQHFHDALGIQFSVIGRADQYYPDAPGSVAGGRSLEVTMYGQELGEWRSRLRPSPHFKVGITQKEQHDNSIKRGAPGALAPLLAQRREEDFLTLGQALSGAFLKSAVVDQNALVYLNVDVTELTMDGRRVTGAVAVIEGQRVRIESRAGVLLATGSYGYHPDVARMEGLPAIKEQAPPIIHGDGMRLAGPTPAAVTRSGITFTTLGFPSATETHPGSDEPLYHPVYASLAVPHSIVVNQEGQRFGDETFYGTFINDIQAFDAHKKRFPNYPAFLIMDDRYRQRYPLAQLDHWPEEELSSAESIDELAFTLGVDERGLQAGVDRYNDHVDRGHDGDYHRGQHEFAAKLLGDPTYEGNPTLGKISEPPFWGVKLEIVGAGIYSMGLQIDEHARAVDREGRPVPGLYVTGNAAAYTEILHGYEGGLANLRNVVYSYLAANHAADGV